MPFVLLDSDKTGREYVKQVKNGAYKKEPDKVLDIATFLGNKEYEIEDLLPAKALIEIVDRTFRGRNYFADFYKADEPIVDQIENWAKGNDITLSNGWKVELARAVINQFDRVMKDIPEELIKKWEKLFLVLLS